MWRVERLCKRVMKLYNMYRLTQTAVRAAAANRRSRRRRGKDGAVYPLSARAHSTRVQSRLRTADPCLHRAHSARREAWAAFAPLTAVAGLRLFAVRSPEDWRAGDARAGWPALVVRVAADECLTRCRSGRSEVRCLAPSRCCTEGRVES